MSEAIDVFYSYSMRGQFQVIKKTSHEYSEHSVVMRKPTENVTLPEFESNKPRTHGNQQSLFTCNTLSLILNLLPVLQT